MPCQRAELQEARAWINQRCYTISDQHLSTIDMLLSRLVCPSLRSFGMERREPLCKLTHRGRIVAIPVAIGINSSLYDRDLSCLVRTRVCCCSSSLRKALLWRL